MKTTTKKKKKYTNMTMGKVKTILPEDILNLPLNIREYKFIAHYVTNGFDKVKAYKEAGYKSGPNKSETAQANSILNRPTVTQAIKLFVDSAIRPYKEKLEYMILHTVYERAFYKVGDFFDEDGVPLPLDDIPEHKQVCIESIDKKTIGSGENQTFITAYKMANRSDSIRTLMELLAKYDADGQGSNSNFTNQKREEVKSIFNKREDEINKDIFDRYGLTEDPHANKIIKMTK